MMVLGASHLCDLDRGLDDTFGLARIASHAPWGIGGLIWAMAEAHFQLTLG